jgi:hypothetical protein
MATQIVCIGDSITFGLNIDNKLSLAAAGIVGFLSQSHQSWCERMHSMLDGPFRTTLS